MILQPLVNMSLMQRSKHSPPDLMPVHGNVCSYCSFKEASDDLCHALAFLACMCTHFIHPEILAPLLACRLVALDNTRVYAPLGCMRLQEE